MRVFENIIKNSIDLCKLYSTTIELCTTCNWRCKYCYLREHCNGGLSFEEIIDIFNQLRKLGVYDLALTGGEIFTRKDILDIIKDARKKGFSVNLMSNISLLDESIINQLDEMKITSISCSIFSLDDEIHDEFVGKHGELQKVKFNLNLLKKTNIKVIVKVMIMDFNYQEIERFKKYCLENNFDLKFDVRIFPRLNQDNSVCSYGLNIEKLAKLILKLDEQNGVEYEDKINQYICASTRNSIYIDASGNLKACGLIDRTLGNIHDFQICEIIENSNLLKYIRNHTWKDLKENCQKCEKSKYCIRCPGICLLDNKNFRDKSENNCKLAEARWRALAIDGKENMNERK